MVKFNPKNYPASDVFLFPNQPTIVFATVHTKNRVTWLNTPEVHTALIEVWKQAGAWLVGRYVIMPDHIHMFVAPCKKDTSIELWVKYWKSLLTKSIGRKGEGWQTRCWHHRLRDQEEYEQKWHYIMQNPYRAGLVKVGENWPYQGELEILRW